MPSWAPPAWRVLVERFLSSRSVNWRPEPSAWGGGTHRFPDRVVFQLPTDGCPRCGARPFRPALDLGRRQVLAQCVECELGYLDALKLAHRDLFVQRHHAGLPHLPASIFSLGLDPYALRVLARLIRRGESTGSVTEAVHWENDEDRGGMAHGCQMSPRRTYRALAVLERKGLIRGTRVWAKPDGRLRSRRFYELTFDRGTAHIPFQLDNSTLAPIEVAVVLALGSQMSETVPAGSREVVSRLLGRHPATVGRALATLRRRGLVECVGAGRSARTYRLASTPEWETAPPVVSAKTTSIPPVVSAETTFGTPRCERKNDTPKQVHRLSKDTGKQTHVALARDERSATDNGERRPDRVEEGLAAPDGPRGRATSSIPAPFVAPPEPHLPPSGASGVGDDESPGWADHVEGCLRDLAAHLELGVQPGAPIHGVRAALDAHGLYSRSPETNEAFYDLEERAAIVEYDGRQPRWKAERLTLALPQSAA